MSLTAVLIPRIVTPYYVTVMSLPGISDEEVSKRAEARGKWTYVASVIFPITTTLSKLSMCSFNLRFLVGFLLQPHIFALKLIKQSRSSPSMNPESTRHEYF